MPAICRSFLETGTKKILVPLGSRMKHPAQSHSIWSPWKLQHNVIDLFCLSNFSWAHGELGWDTGSLHGGGCLRGACPMLANIAVVVLDGYKCLELDLLFSVCQFLQRLGLHTPTLRASLGKKSLISNSLVDGRREISFRDLIFMSLIRWPSLLTGATPWPWCCLCVLWSDPCSSSGPAHPC